MHKVTQRQRVINRSDYNRELAKANLGNNIANHMAYIFAAILYDKFDFTFKQVTNYYKKTVDMRMKWQDDDNGEVTNESLLAYSIKKKIDAVGFVKSIPMSQKLYMADIKRGRAVIGADKNIESAFLSTLLLSFPTLKETYKFSNAKIEEFFQYVAYAIKMYSAKLPKDKGNVFDDEYIRKCFIEDEGFDMKIGDYVNKDEVRK